jgi:hypothetical protein
MCCHDHAVRLRSIRIIREARTERCTVLRRRFVRSTEPSDAEVMMFVIRHTSVACISGMPASHPCAPFHFVIPRFALLHSALLHSITLHTSHFALLPQRRRRSSISLSTRNAVPPHRLSVFAHARRTALLHRRSLLIILHRLGSRY